MKKIIFLFVLSVSSLGFHACSGDDDFTFIAKTDPDGIVFENTPLASYALDAKNSDNLGERFVWNEVDFDVPSPVYYELQASATNTFEGITVLANDLTETNYGVTVGNLLDVAEEGGLDNDPETEAPNSGSIYFRVRAYLGDDAANTIEQLSDTLALNVILTEPTDGGGIEIKQHLYLVGDVTAAGWNPDNTNTPLFRDPENESVFNFTGRFAGSADTEGFKLLETLGQWQPQWGLDNGSVSNSDLLGSDPSAFKATEDAYYSFSINTEDLTYTLEVYNASAAATYTTIGIIGDATANEWNSDTDLTQSTFDPHIWYIKGIELTDGEAKFRAEDAWDTSWGAATELSGQGMNNNDPNIPVTAGTYNVWFNDLDGRYILIPQQ